MQTYIFKIIDGIEIIKGFRRPSIDYVATRKKAVEVLDLNDDYKALIKQRASIVRQVTRQSRLPKNRTSVGSLSGGAGNSEAQYWALLNKRLRPIDEQIKAIQEAAFSDNRIYHHPAAYERLISDAEAETLIEARRNLEPKQLLKTDGEVITDYRGRYAHLDNGTWETLTIESLGDEPGEGFISVQDLTPEQHQEIQQQELQAQPLEEREQQAQAERENVVESLSHVFMRRLIASSAPINTIRSDIQAMRDTRFAAIATKYGL